MRLIEILGAGIEYHWIGPAPGQAPTLVFLHEGLGSAAAWRDYPARIAAATGCGALLYSRRGYGGSDPAPRSWSPDFMHREARDCLPALLTALGVGDHLLYGHSDGASIALIYAAQQPTGLRGLVAEAPHLLVEAQGVAAIRAMGERFRTTDLAKRLSKYHGTNTDAVFWGWHDVWVGAAFRDWSLESLIPAIRAPILALQGLADEYGSTLHVERLRDLVTGTVEIELLPDCGHSPHKEQPAVADRVCEFVKRVAG